MYDNVTITSATTSTIPTVTNVVYTGTTPLSNLVLDDLVPNTLYYPYDANCLNVTKAKEINIGISDVKLITDDLNITHGVIMEFADGDKQKSICSEEDVFNLETGYLICLTKHLFKLRGSDNPTRDLAKNIRKAFKVYDDKILKELEEEDKKQRIAYRKAKRAEKKKRRAERKANAEKERQINIQKEAIIRAMRELEACKDDLK